MKILFGSLLGVLILTHLSCKKCPNEEITSKIIGISLSTPFNNSSAMTSFEDYLFSVQVMDSVIEIRTTQNTRKKELTQYATFGPFGCETKPGWPTFINDLDSMFVTTDKVYNGIVGNDMTGILVERETNRSVSEYPTLYKKGMTGDLYKLNAPPSKLDTFQFILQAKDSKGRIFKDTIMNVIISPK